jgi:phosphoenolpyruvate carboxylase
LHLEKLLNELDGAIDPLSDASRRPLYLLHAIRIALMMRLLLFAADLPMFAPRSEFSREVLVDLLLEMRVEEAINLLAETFPKAGSGAGQYSSFQKNQTTAREGPAATRISMRTSSSQCGKSVICLKVIGVGLSHRFGAYG